MLKHRFLFPIYIALGISTFVFGIVSGIFWWFILVCFVGLGVTAWGSFDIRAGYFVPTYFRKEKPEGKIVAITFDDGPTAYTTEVLQVLKTYDVKATFFCIGKQVLAYPNVVKQVLAERHTVGNHTFSHTQQFGFLNEKKVVEELQHADEVISDVIGKKPVFFRPPFGVTNPSVAKAVKYTKHKVIGWSNRSLDTVTINEDTIYARVCRKLKSGDIILFHDTSERTLNVLKRLLPYLKEQGFRCVSVDDLLDLYAYDT